MKILITPSEVVAIAFDHPQTLCAGAVTEAAILAAQRKFIKPALGNFYAELLEERHADLLAEYIKTPLALYVKWLVMPALAVQSGNMGVVQHRTDNFIPADRRALSRARQGVKSDAQALLQCAVEYIRQNPSLYPDFDGAAPSAANGGIIL